MGIIQMQAIGQALFKKESIVPKQQNSHGGMTWSACALNCIPVLQKHHRLGLPTHCSL